MNYLDLLNRFYDLLQETRVSNNAQLLYYTLLQINNKCSWANWFARTNVSISGLMCASENALTRARNELKQLGLIDFTTSKKRGECTRYHLLYHTNECTKELQTEYKRGTEEVQKGAIDKQRLKQRQRLVDTGVPSAADPPRIDYETYRNAFVSSCPSLPKPQEVKKWSDARKKAIRDKHMTPEEIAVVFERVEQSDFLSGRKNGNGWCGLDWILKPKNWQKINEGNYDNHPGGKPPSSGGPSYDIEAYERSSIFDD